MKFLKMHGLGNDFVILDHRQDPVTLSCAQIEHICNRHTGVGCDQLIIMEPSDRGDFFMRIYNPDGSQSEACGNATRCVAHVFMRESGARACTVETLRGVLSCALQDNGHVRVNMGAPLAMKSLTALHFPAPTPSDAMQVNIGNPHVVFVVDDADSVPLSEVGPVIEHDDLFPNRTNVEFIHLQDDASIRVRVWERGAGITLACGSGACAVAVAAVEQGLVGNQVTIHMDGGALDLEYVSGGDAVFMTGPVAYVFSGEIDL